MTVLAALGLICAWKQVPLTSLQVRQAIWTVVPGRGLVSEWAVNDICTLVRVKRNGVLKVFDLPENRSQHGLNSLYSALAISDDKLFVTTSKGVFSVDSRGMVISQIDPRTPREFSVQGKAVRRMALAGPYEEPPGNRLLAKTSSPTQTACTYAEDDSYLVFLDHRLRRKWAYRFQGEHVQGVVSIPKSGWKVVLAKGKSSRLVRISSEGRLLSAPRLDGLPWGDALGSRVPARERILVRLGEA